jgi:hypothetical protein
MCASTMCADRIEIVRAVVVQRRSKDWVGRSWAHGRNKECRGNYKVTSLYASHFLLFSIAESLAMAANAAKQNQAVLLGSKVAQASHFIMFSQSNSRG